MTKEELIKDAVTLVSGYPQVITVGRGDTLFTSSATVYYNMLLPAAMEAFVYGFGIVEYSLTNPEESSEDKPYRIYNLPRTEVNKQSMADVGYVLAVCPIGQLPEIRHFIGTRGVRQVGSFPFTKISDSGTTKLQVWSTMEGLAIAYVKKFPDPEIMTSNFRNMLIYNIATQLALKRIQQKNIAQMLEYKAVMFKHLAQKFSLDNTTYFQYIQPSLASAALDPIPPKEAPRYQIPEYIRGV